MMMEVIGGARAIMVGPLVVGNVTPELFDDMVRGGVRVWGVRVWGVSVGVWGVSARSRNEDVCAAHPEGRGCRVACRRRRARRR